MTGVSRTRFQHSYGRFRVTSTVMSARAAEHGYFLAAAVVVTALVLWAFGFEYRDLIHPSQFTLLVQVHGLVMFTWVGLFLTQAALIAWHRPAWHRRAGVIGMAVAVLVVGLGVPTAIVASIRCSPRNLRSPSRHCDGAECTPSVRAAPLQDDARRL